MKKKNRRMQKNIKLFLNSEEGKMLDADIVKTAVAFGFIGVALAGNAEAAQREKIHTNYFDASSHKSSLHGSHGSHGSHARGGWC